MSKLSCAALCCAMLVLASESAAQYGAVTGQWPVYGAGNGNTKYAALDLINPSNLADLTVAWEWVSVDASIQEEFPDDPLIARATYFQCTPLMVDGVLYLSTSLGQAAAVDAVTGETLWSYNSESFRAGRPPNLGFISRGVAYWQEGNDARIYMSTGDSYLVALDARSGTLVESFGDKGKVDLTRGVRDAPHGRGYGHPSPPLICRGVIIVGSSISDGAVRQKGVPGRVKAFDVRTGAPRWNFNVIPQEGEFGTESWDNEAWRYTGGGNVWSIMSADDALGYVYLPTSTPTNDFYGGHRLGRGLFAESLVCLEAETGKRVWHFQMVHHGVWDYDLPAAPNLVDITVAGRHIKAVAQVTKQGFTFVLDRATGEPVWPIEERPVAQSKVPGEATWPTQPFPTKPPPFARQGVREEDVLDFTPELREEGLKILKGFHYGDLYTPPTLDKTLITVPGYGGGANWPGAAFDPETGMLYVPSLMSPSVFSLTKPDKARSDFRYTRGRSELAGPQGLPLFKPPYAEIVALDLNEGTLVWRAVNGGNGPIDHPAVKDLNLSPMGTKARAAALVTKSLLFVTEGSGRSGSAVGGGNKLRAFDKRTGEVLASIELPGHATGVPMTYFAEGRQYIAVAVGTNPARLVAFTLAGEGY